MPAYNAAKTLTSTIRRIPPLKGLPYKIYIIDDGSTDNILNEVHTLQAQHVHEIVLIRHACNQGYGAAQKSGIAASLQDGNEYHIVLHADGQYAPEEIPLLLGPLIQKTADVVIGSKFLKGHVLKQGMPFMRMLGLRLMDLLENRWFGYTDMEFHSGYMSYSISALQLLPYRSFTDKYHFDGSMVIWAAAHGLRIEKVPITTSYAKDSTRLSVLPYLIEIIQCVVNFKKNTTKV